MAVENFSWLIEGEVAGHGLPTGSDDIAWLHQQGVRSLVHMESWPDEWLQRANQLGMVHLYVPVRDGTAPALRQVDEMIDFMLKSVLGGKPVAVSCSAGNGRTGTVLSCYLVARDHTAEGLVIQVRSRRPQSVEVTGQWDVIRQYLSQLFNE